MELTTENLETLSVVYNISLETNTNTASVVNTNK